MKITLTIPERIAGIRLLNEGEDGLTLTGLKSALELLDIFVLTEKEQEETGFKEEIVETEDGVKAARVVWKDQAYEKELKVSKEQKQVLDDLIEQKDKDKKFNMAEGMAIISLAEKLN